MDVQVVFFGEGFVAAGVGAWYLFPCGGGGGSGMEGLDMAL